MTLLEVMVSIGILALIGTLIYGAFDGMAKAKKGLSRINDRYHQGRGAVARISRELQSSFISGHQPLDLNLSVRNTAFVGHDSGDSDRVDFTSFSHRRFGKNLHESDQNELSYFMSRDPDSDRMDLVRREAKTIDLEPGKGGVIQVLAENVASFDLAYLDPVTGEWVDSWDSTQAAGQLGRLPAQVKVTLIMNGGIGDKPLKLVSKTPLAMQTPLVFGVQ